MDFKTFEIIPVEFWLPLIFPERIRLIVTIEKGSQADKYYKGTGVEFLELIPAPAAIEK